VNAISAAQRYDVAVCGAGPVGMTAAALLAARGLDVVVLERRSTTSDEPKAISIDDEALRVYQQAGIAAEVLSIVVPGTGTRYYDSNDKALFHGRAAVPYRLGYPFKNPFAQPDLERVLLAALRAHPRIDVHFDTEVTALTQDGDAVTLTAPNLSVQAAFALGCDGGRSTMRSLLEISMTGRGHPVQPGDIILSGTPGGVGYRRDPQVFLHPGDTVHVQIDGVGTVSNTLVAE